MKKECQQRNRNTEGIEVGNNSTSNQNDVVLGEPRNVLQPPSTTATRQENSNMKNDQTGKVETAAEPPFQPAIWMRGHLTRVLRPARSIARNIEVIHFSFRKVFLGQMKLLANTRPCRDWARTLPLPSNSNPAAV